MNQLPFTSINFGLSTEPEGRMISKHILEVCREGLGKFHRTSIFPCVIFQCKSGVNRKPGDPNYDLFQLALKCTSERLYPNYANCDWSSQKKWIEYDRELKYNIINSLSEEDQYLLYEKLYEDFNLRDKLGLNDNLEIKVEESPTEVFSTMGKCKLQPM